MHPNESPPHSLPTLTDIPSTHHDGFNPDDYRDDLQAFELSQDQEDELLAILWNIMATMVDIGWGTDTIQLILPDIFEKACNGMCEDHADSLEIINGHESSEDEVRDD